jgi:hypothetical protein
MEGRTKIMCKVNCEVTKGLMPSEVVARILNAEGGFEEVAVPTQQIVGKMLIASEIGRHEGKVLVELPGESSSGRWRIWVKEQSIGE